jgi:prepilin-type N-terminal cleavage/methylation domain-containing protein
MGVSCPPHQPQAIMVNMDHGFSLTETLIALMLMTTLSLLLLKQQWQMSQWVRHEVDVMQAHVKEDNDAEMHS